MDFKKIVENITGADYKGIASTMLATPLLTSLLVVDFATLVLHRPPALFSILLLGGLVALAMYFGQKLALFQLKPSKS